MKKTRVRTEEMVYRLMNQTGVCSLVVGIISLVVGITIGVIGIISGARLLNHSSDIL